MPEKLQNYQEPTGGQEDTGQANAIRSWARCPSHLQIHRLCFIIPLILYAAHRLWFAMSGRCTLDSDEGILGIMAIRALRGELHPFFLGQDYMGSFQSLAAAPFMLLFGKTPMAMRVTAIIEGIAVLLIWRRLFAHFRLPNAWPFFALLLVFSTEYMTTWMLKSRGGYIEILLLGSLWLLAIVEVAVSKESFEKLWKQWALVGLATGVAWWTSQLSIFFFVPGAALLLCARGTIARLREGFAPIGLALAILLAIATALIELRPSVPYDSSLSTLLFRARGAIVAIFAIAMIAALLAAWRRILPRWTAALALGFAVGTLPAVWVSLTKPILYNTTQFQPPDRWLINATSLVFEASGSLLGLTDPSFFSIGMPRWLLIVLPIICAIVLVVSALSVVKRKREADVPLPTGEAFLLGASIFGFAFLTLTLRSMNMVPHYAVFAMFFGAGVWACFLARLWEMRMPGRIAALGLLAFMACVHLAGTVKAEKIPVHPLTGVRRDDQEIIDFLLAHDLPIAATGFSSASSGYWEAYRITMSSGERVRIHPILHMPRVSEYREELKRAKRTAIVAHSTFDADVALTPKGIPFRTDTVGGMTIIWDFDKARVDELGLMNYAATLETP